jgi:hypothetical protein
MLPRMGLLWIVLDHPRTSLVVTLTVGGGALWTPSHVTGTVLWVLAAIVAVASLLSWRKSRRSTSDSPEDLEVKIESVVFDPFKHKALIGEIRVAVTNNTDLPKPLRGVQIRQRGPFIGWAWGDDEVTREVGSRTNRQRDAMVGTIPPRQTERTRLVTAFAHAPEGGEQSFSIVVEDGVGNEFGCEWKAKPPKRFRWPP